MPLEDYDVPTEHLLHDNIYTRFLMSFTLIIKLCLVGLAIACVIFFTSCYYDALKSRNKYKDRIMRWKRKYRSSEMSYVNKVFADDETVNTANKPSESSVHLQDDKVTWNASDKSDDDKFHLVDLANGVLVMHQDQDTAHQSEVTPTQEEYLDPKLIDFTSPSPNLLVPPNFGDCNTNCGSFLGQMMRAHGIRNNDINLNLDTPATNLLQFENNFVPQPVLNFPSTPLTNQLFNPPAGDFPQFQSTPSSFYQSPLNQTLNMSPRSFLDVMSSSEDDNYKSVNCNPLNGYHEVNFMNDSLNLPATEDDIQYKDVTSGFESDEWDESTEEVCSTSKSGVVATNGDWTDNSDCEG